MIFSVELGHSTTTFIATPETPEERSGQRGQPPFTPITLAGERGEVTFGIRADKVHPDLLGLVCLVLFQPFIRNEITFPQPVSTALRDVLADGVIAHMHYGETHSRLHTFTVRNVDESLEPYAGGNTPAIAFGGGFDSVAVAVMLPDAPLVHMHPVKRGSYDLPADEIAPMLALEDGMKSVSRARELHIVTTDVKEVATPRGFPTWATVFAVPLLLAGQYGINSIATGSVFEANFMQAQRGFYPFHEKEGPWYQAFRRVGIPVFSPVVGIIEIGTAKIVCQHKLAGLALYCQDGSGGIPCGRCPKCMRKLAMRCYHGDLDPDTPGMWAPFDSSVCAGPSMSHLSATSISSTLVYDPILHLLPRKVRERVEALRNIPSLRLAAEILTDTYFGPAVSTLPAFLQPLVADAFRNEGFRPTSVPQTEFIKHLPPLQ